MAYWHGEMQINLFLSALLHCKNEQLEPFVDDIYFLYDIDDYVETALYYEKLEDVSDETMEKILEDVE